MIQKEFDKGPTNVNYLIFKIYLYIQIEAPNTNEVNLNEDAETEEDVITNGKDLYKKFEDLVTKDHISIGSHK